ncbi:MAG TPA: flagellar biosynthesis protein FliQ, partial [bacterium]|nr:flagellar biosynthesis protein FliQ [bacterium]
MTLGEAVTLIKSSLITVIMLGGPALIVSLVVGILISLFQSLTQIHEATLAFVPKILAVFLVLILLGGWMLNYLLNFTSDIFARMGGDTPIGEILGLSTIQAVSFLLIFLRLFSFISVFQPFGGRFIPVSIRLLLAISIGLALSHIYILKDLPDINLLILISVKEIIIGLVIGFLANIIFYTLQVIGQMIDFQVGLSMANIVNPAFDIQVSPIGDLFFVFGMLLFLVTGGYTQIIESIAYSFNIVPVGEVSINGDIFVYAFKLIGNFVFQVALRFSAPVITILLLVDVITGIIARTVPQINIFIVGLPLKTGLAFLSILLLIGGIPDLM